MNIESKFAIAFHKLGYSEFFATKHKFVNDGLTPGTPFDIESTIKELQKLLPVASRGSIDLIPDNVFFQQENLLGWVMPPRIVTLLFKGAIMTSYKVPMPKLIFIAKGGSSPVLKVCAIKSDATVSLDTPIYYAPLPNVYASHSMCIGDVELPKTPLYENMTKYESAMFNTYSTHTNHNNTINVENCDSSKYVRFMAKLQREKTTTFDDCHLVDAEETLQNLLGEL